MSEKRHLKELFYHHGIFKLFKLKNIKKGDLIKIQDSFKYCFILKIRKANFRKIKFELIYSAFPNDNYLPFTANELEPYYCYTYYGYKWSLFNDNEVMAFL